MSHIRGQPRHIKRRRKTNLPLQLKIPLRYISGYFDIDLLSTSDRNENFIKQYCFSRSNYYNIITAYEVTLNANFNFFAPYLCLNETKNNYNITAFKIHACILAFSENRR